MSSEGSRSSSSGHFIQSLLRDANEERFRIYLPHSLYEHIFSHFPFKSDSSSPLPLSSRPPSSSSSSAVASEASRKLYAMLESMDTKRQIEVELAVSDVLSDDPDELMISNDILRSLGATSHFQLQLRLHLSATARRHLNAYEVILARSLGYYIDRGTEI